jgi:hypothetical protein
MSNNLPVKHADTKQVARFADGEVFVRQTPEGQLKAVKTVMGLDQREKELCPVGGSVMITTYGFDKMNRVAGLSVVFPPEISITVNRRGFPETAKVENPYIEYDEDDGSIKVITTECMAIGLSPIGNWCITQERLRFDLRQYLIAELWSKVKNKPRCGSFVTKQAYQKDPDPNRMWVPVMSGCGLSVDLMHEEIMKVISGHITRQKFAERISRSICRRNAMKRHPAIAQSIVQPNDGYAEVEVVGWQHDKSADDMKRIASVVADRGAVPSAITHEQEPVVIDGTRVEVATEETQVEYGDEEKTVVEGEVSEEEAAKNEQGAGISQEQATLFDEEQSSIGDREKNLIWLGEMEEALGTEQMNEVIDQIAPDTPDANFPEMTDDQLSSLVATLKEWDRNRKR